MLQSLREHAQGWIAGFIATVLCLAFALWGVESYINIDDVNNVIAKVEGKTITQDQVDLLYRRLSGVYKPPGSSLNPAVQEKFQRQLKEGALTALIQQYALTMAAEKAGYRISDAQVASIIQNMPAFQVYGQFSYDTFVRILTPLSHTPSTFMAEIKHSRLLQQVRQSLSDSNFSLLEEDQHAMALEHQSRSFAYMLISPTHSHQQPMITDQAIQSYYQTHTQDFKTEEQVSLQYLMLSPEAIMPKIQISESAIKQYYRDNYMGKNSNPVPFERVKKTIEQALRQQQAEQWVSNQTDKLVNLTYTHPDSLKYAADALDCAIQSTPFFTRQGDKTRLLSNKEVLAASFSDTVLKQHNNSDMINLDDHTVVVIRLADYKPSTVKPLFEVRGLILSILKQQATQEQIISLGEKILKAARNDNRALLSSLMNQYHLEWIKAENVHRADKKIPADILAFIFNQSVLDEDVSNLHKEVQTVKSMVAGGLLSNDRFIITHITSVTQEYPTATEIQQRQNAHPKAMRNLLGILDYDSYLAQTLTEAKISRIH